MRTTIDLPDDLMRRAKATAALRGIKLKELIEALLREGLSPVDKERLEGSAKGQGRPVPVSISLGKGPIKPLTNAEIDELFIREDLARWKVD